MTILRVPRELMIFFNDNREIQRYFIDSTNIIDDVLLIGNLLGTTDQIIVTDNGDKTVTLSLPQDIDTDADVVFDSITVETVDYELGLAAAATLEGRTSWNNDDKTLNIDTGLGPVLQTNQETVVIVYNDTGVEISNGVVVHPVAGATDGRPHVELAIANVHTGIDRDIWVTTMVIPIDSVGIVTQFGYVRGVDTSLFSAGDNLWVSPDNAGEYVNTLPEFPDYAIQVGGVAVSDALEGVIFVDVKGRAADTTLNFWNGVFRESFDFLVTSDGATITGALSPANGHDDMTMIFSDGLTLLDTSPPQTITLTPGTDEIPQTNYIYILQSDKILTVSISAWPDAQHIKVAQCFLQSAATTQIDGQLRNQNWNDHIEDTFTFQGHLSHITQKLRQFNAQWDTGVEGSVTIDTVPSPDSVLVHTTAGFVYQLHRQSFPAQNMTPFGIDAVIIGAAGGFVISGDGDLSSDFIDGNLFSVYDSTNNDGIYTITNTVFSTPDFIITVEETVGAVADGLIGDDIHIVNHPTTPYTATTDLNTQILDSTGGSLANSSFSFVVWGVQNKTGEVQHLMLNLPTGTYPKNSPDLAVSDALNYSVYDIPKAFQGVAFLISRFTFVLQAGGLSWSLYDTEDLRGTIPNVSAGGGAGGTGVTTYLGLTDTPSAYTGEANNVPVVNAGETALEFLDITSDFLTQYLRTDGTRTLTGNLGVDALVTIDGRDISVDGSTLDTLSGLSHTQGTDTALGTLGTKATPIDADKVIQRDSTSSDSLVTSTWTQIKAFLKTYFDVLYQPISTTGAWTPVLGGATSETGQTYAVQAGNYVKVGSLVTCTGYIRLSAKGTIVGNLLLKGLPFTVDNSLGSYSSSSFGFFTGWTLTAGHVLSNYIIVNTTTIALQESEFQGDAATSLTTAAIADNTRVMFNFSYFTDD